MRHHSIAVTLAGLLASACSFGPAAPPTTYDLLAPKVMTLTAPKPARFQLVVNEPNAVRSLENDRILVRTGAAQVSYYKDAAWTDRLPRLMQARIVEAFQNAGLVSAVGSRADRLDADIEMASEVIAFQVEVEGGKAMAHANLYVKVIDGKTGRMLSSRGFDARVATSSTDVKQMVVSLNEAFDKVLRDVVPWVAARQPKA